MMITVRENQRILLKIDKPTGISKILSSGSQNGDIEIQSIDLNDHSALQDSPESGNGCVQAQKIAAQKEDLAATNIPCAPAVFSVKEGTYGPGIRNGGVSDEEAGHAGIVLSCKKPDNGNYFLTYIHTYNGLSENGHNSSIRTKEFSPSDNVTYVNIGKYIK